MNTMSLHLLLDGCLTSNRFCKRYKRCFLILVWLLIPVLSSASQWIDSERYGQFAYFLHDMDPRVEAYDLVAKEWLTSRPLPRTPTTFHVDDTFIYIAYGQALYRYSHEMENETHLGNFASPVLSVHTDEDLVLVNYSTTSRTNIQSLNRETGAYLYNMNDYYGMSAADLSPSANLMVGRGNGRTFRISYEDSGEFIGSGYEQGNLNDYDSQQDPGCFVWPDGRTLTVENGNSRELARMEIVGDFDAPVLGMQFYGGTIPIILSFDKVVAYSKDYRRTDVVPLERYAETIYLTDSELVLFYPPTIENPSTEVGFIALNEINLDEPGEPVSADQLTYEPVDIFMSGSVVNLLIREIRTLYRYDTLTQSWVDAIELARYPTGADYSEEHDRIYISSGRKVTFLDLAQEEPSETFFSEINSWIDGIKCIEGFVFIQYNRGYIVGFDSQGTEMESRYLGPNFDFRASDWHPVNSRLYQGGFQIEIKSDGTFGSMVNAYMSEVTSLNDAGTKILTANGMIYDAQNLAAIVGVITEEIVDGFWIGDNVFSLSEDSIKVWYGPTYAEGPGFEVIGDGLRILDIENSDRIVSIHQGVNGRLRIVVHNQQLDVVPLSSLAVPQLKVGYASARMAQLEWNYVKGADEYQIQRRSGSQLDWTTVAAYPPARNRYLDLDVTKGVSYEYRIRASNGNLHSAYSESFSVNLDYPPADLTPSSLAYPGGRTDILFIDNSDILYVTNPSLPRIYRWDTISQKWLMPIALQDTPYFVYYSEFNHCIYTWYATDEMTKIDLGTFPFEEVPFIELDSDSSRERVFIAAVGENVLASGYGRASLISAIGTVLDDISLSSYRNRALWDPIQNRLVVYRQQGSGIGIIDFFLQQEILKYTYSQPLNGAYADELLAMSPDFKKLFFDNGVVANTENFQAVISGLEPLDHAVWTKGGVFGVRDNRIISISDDSFDELDARNFEGYSWDLLANTEGKLVLLASSELHSGDLYITVFDPDLGIHPPEVLDTPALSLVEMTASSVSLTWTDIAGEEAYRLEHFDDSSASWELVSSFSRNITEFTDLSIMLGDSRNYRLVATDRDDRGSVSNTLSVVLLPPDPVSATTVLNNDFGQVLVEWNDVENETGFAIYRMSDISPWQRVGLVEMNVTEFLDANAGEGITYHYRVVAYNGIRSAAPGPEAVITTDIFPPDPPAQLSATVMGPFQVRLEWPHVFKETHFIIQRSEPFVDPDEWTTIEQVEANTIAFNDWTVLPEADYRYRIFAVNTGGSSSAVHSSLVLTPTLSQPAQPVVTVYQLSGSEVQLFWDLSPNAQNYRVLRRASGSEEWILLDELGIQESTFIDSGLQMGNSYEYSVISVNSLGESNNLLSSAIKMNSIAVLLTEDFESGYNFDIWTSIYRGVLVSPGASGSDQSMGFRYNDSTLQSQLLPLVSGGQIQFQFRVGLSDDPSGFTPAEGDLLVIRIVDGSSTKNLATFDMTDPKFSEWQIISVEIPDSYTQTDVRIEWKRISDFTFYPGILWALDNISIYTNFPAIPQPPMQVFSSRDEAGTVHVFWTDAPTADAYRVERSVDSGEWNIIADSLAATYLEDRDVLEGTDYSYRVYSLNMGGISGEATVSSPASIPMDLALARTAGQEDVRQNPNDFGLYKEEQLLEAEQEARQEVIDSPSLFFLYTAGDLQVAFDEGQDSVLSDPNLFGLYTSQSENYFLLEDTIISISEDLTTIEWTLWKSSDLKIWEPFSTGIEFSPLDQDPLFLRLRPD